MCRNGNRHCANCIGALSFPILTVRLVSELWQDVFKQMYARPITSNKYACGSKIARPYSIHKATLKIKKIKDKKTSSQNILTQGCVAAAHDPSIVFARWRKCASHLIYMVPCDHTSRPAKTASRSVHPLLHGSWSSPTQICRHTDHATPSAAIGRIRADYAMHEMRTKRNSGTAFHACYF